MRDVFTVEPVKADPIRILLVEDDDACALLIQNLLTRWPYDAFSIRRTDCLAAALRETAIGEIDLVLLDLGLPDSRGLDTFVRMHAAAARVPIIVLSGLDDETLGTATVQQGAQDYIIKGQAPELCASLVRSIRYAIERCRAQQALADEHDLLRNILDNLPDQVYLKNKEGRFVAANPATFRFFGASAFNEIIGKSDFDFFPHELADQFLSEEQGLLQRDQPCVNREAAITDAAGHPRWLLTTKVLLRDHAGNFQSLLGINRDITELKRAEAYREMAREILQLLNEPGDLQIVLQRVLAVLKTRTGFDAVGLRLQDGDDFPYVAQKGFSPDFLLTENTLIGRAADGDVCRNPDGTVSLECTCGLIISGKTDPANPLFTRGGSCWTNDSFPLLDLPPGADPRRRPRNTCIHQGYASVALVPIRVKDRIVGLIQFNDRRKGCFSLDRIEQLEGIASLIGAALMRTRMDDQLKQAHADLIKTHEALAATQMRLIEAAKMESVGQLAAGVAHEVKNPLAIALMGLEFLSNTVATNDAQVATAIQDTKEALLQADYIVRELLNFSAPAHLEMKLQDLNVMVEHALRLARLEARNRQVSVYMDLGQNLPLLPLDRIKIEQVFLNLCMNAIESMPEGGTLLLKTRSQPLETGGTEVIAEVEDTGPGIPDGNLPKVFDPFFTKKQMGKGTGLGLSVAKQIIELHGGTIKIGNRPEGGARVTITLRTPTGE
jgi:PAS domain S-box-containing protein